MMNKQVRFFSIIGIVFGTLTIISGSAVLLGSNPGYVVFLPLVLFNTTMGLLYIVSGIVAWKIPMLGKVMAGGVFLLNLTVLVIISFLYITVSDIALQSLGAMLFRCIVWLTIYFGLARAVRQ